MHCSSFEVWLICWWSHVDNDEKSSHADNDDDEVDDEVEGVFHVWLFG